jgi:hypothetical protein
MQSFHSPFGRASHFSCSCKKSNQKNTPQHLRPGHSGRGSLPSAVLRRLHIPVQTTQSARSIAPPLRASRSGPPQLTGTPRAEEQIKSSDQELLLLPSYGIEQLMLSLRSPGMDGRRSKSRRLRGAEHRRLRRKMPARGVRRMRTHRQSVHGRTVCRPRLSREAQGTPIRRKRIGAPRWRLAFLVTFWAMPKSNPLSAGERKPLLKASKEEVAAGAARTARTAKPAA